jgi:hypothetical protein
VAIEKSKNNMAAKPKYISICTSLSSFSKLGMPLNVDEGANDRYNMQLIIVIDFQ